MRCTTLIISFQTSRRVASPSRKNEMLPAQVRQIGELRVVRNSIVNFRKKFSSSLLWWLPFKKLVCLWTKFVDKMRLLIIAYTLSGFLNHSKFKLLKRDIHFYMDTGNNQGACTSIFWPSNCWRWVVYVITRFMNRHRLPKSRLYCKCMRWNRNLSKFFIR